MRSSSRRERVTNELTQARASYVLEGETAEASNSFWDIVLAILKAIAGVIVFIVGALLVFIGALVRVIGEILSSIGDAIDWLEQLIFGVLAAVLIFVSGGTSPRSSPRSGRSSTRRSSAFSV
jgi:hypothetical protein